MIPYTIPKSTILDLTHPSAVADLRYGKSGVFRVGRYDANEDRVLLDLHFNERASMKAIVYALRRSPASIRGRLRRMGASPASVRRLRLVASAFGGGAA